MKRRIAGLLALAIVFATGVMLISRYYTPTNATTHSTSVDSAKVALEIKEPQILYGMVVDNHLVVEDKIKRNQSLSDILNEYNVPATLIHDIAQMSRNIFDVRKIAPDKKYTLICTQDSTKRAKAFVYEPNAIDYIIFNFDDTLTVNLYKRDIVTIEKTITGEIVSNLSETIEEMGISHELTNKFVDIFGWQVDFQRLQKGDKFKLIYEENQVEGKYVGIKQINAIYFEHYNTPYYAFPFDQGEGVDYFDAEGNSLRKALLKYPIEFTRISSRYTLNRFHPV
jgi:hypothetical protein